MRALCGAIITAAALIGMGLTAQGIGTRYQFDKPYISERDKPPPQEKDQDKEESEADAKKKPAPVAKPPRVLFGDMDRPLIFILVFHTCCAVIGLGIAFLGLMYHHVRRDREFHWERERAAASVGQQRTTV